MDNTAQDNQTNGQTAQSTQPTQPPQPVTPIASSINKEKGVSAFSEVVKPSEEEIKVEEELKNIGIVTNTDQPKLDKIHEQIGVKASAETTPVPTKPSANIKLPLSEEEVDKTLNTKQVRFHLQENVGEHAGEYTEDALPFLAMLVRKILQVHRKIFGKKI